MTATIIVDNRVRLPLAGISEEVATAIKAEFTYANPAFKKAERMRKAMPWIGNPHEETITSWAATEDELSVPRGGLSRVRDLLTSNGCLFTAKDHRCTGDTFGDPIPGHKVEAWGWQSEAIEAAYGKQNCIIRAPTGSGKTTAALGLVSRVGLCTLIIVPNKGIYSVWLDRIQTELGYTTKQIGVLKGGRKRRIAPVTLAMQGTLASMARGGQLEELRDAFGLVLCDEVQKFAANTFYATVDPFAAKFRVGISADETRQDKKEFLIYDLFGQVAFEVSRKKLIDEGKILDVQICIVPSEFEAGWYSMRPDIHALLEAMKNDRAREALILQVAKQEIQAGRQVMILTSRVEHALQIDHALVTMGLQSGTMTGGNDSEFRRTREGLMSGRLRCAVGTVQAIGTGIDFPRLDSAIVVTPMANHKQDLGQVRGRVCRAPEGKEFARLYYVWDRHVYGRKAVENLCKWNTHVLMREGDTWNDARDFLRRHARERVARRVGE